MKEINANRLRRWLLPALKVVGLGVLLIYVTAYVSLSRQGRAEAIRDDSGGFYYFAPDSSRGSESREWLCAILFWPINQIDRWLNPEMIHCFAPLKDLS